MEDQPATLYSPELWEQLTAFDSPRKYPAGAEPFRYGEPVAGIYLVETGQLRLSIPRQTGQPRLFEVVGPGCVLGLSEVLTGGTHKVTAEAVTESELCFISRGTFLNYLREHPEFCMQIVRQLSEELHGLYHHYRADRSRKSPVPPRVN